MRTRTHLLVHGGPQTQQLYRIAWKKYADCFCYVIHYAWHEGCPSLCFLFLSHYLKDRQIESCVKASLEIVLLTCRRQKGDVAVRGTRDYSRSAKPKSFTVMQKATNTGGTAILQQICAGSAISEERAWWYLNWPEGDTLHCPWNLQWTCIDLVKESPFAVPQTVSQTVPQPVIQPVPQAVPQTVPSTWLSLDTAPVENFCLL